MAFKDLLKVGPIGKFGDPYGVGPCGKFEDLLEFGHCGIEDPMWVAYNLIDQRPNIRFHLI